MSNRVIPTVVMVRFSEAKCHGYFSQMNAITRLPAGENARSSYGKWNA